MRAFCYRWEGAIAARNEGRVQTLAVGLPQHCALSKFQMESLIAASIVYVGIENLLRGEVLKARRSITFGFGLIHGFGFASVLREMDIGGGMGGIAIPLFFFNVGVELGQLMVAAATLPDDLETPGNPHFCCLV